MKTAVLIIVTFLSLTVMDGCRPKTTKTNAVRNAELQLNQFRDSLDKISENDPRFVEKLRVELNDFSSSMDKLGEQIEQQGQQSDKTVKIALHAIRQKTDDLNMELQEWSGQSGDSIEKVSDEIKEDFRELKQALRNNINTSGKSYPRPGM